MFNLKIIKASKYYDLKEQSKFAIDSMNYLTNVAENCLIQSLKLKNEIKSLSLEFDVRKIVLGKKASGKTTFLKKLLIPKLKNFFIIDLLGEYSEFDEHRDRLGKMHNRRCDLSADGFHSNLDEERLMASLRSHSNDVIIIDSAHALPRDVVKNILDLLVNGGFDYVMVFERDIPHDRLLPLPFYDCFNQAHLLSDITQLSNRAQESIVNYYANNELAFESKFASIRSEDLFPKGKTEQNI